MVTGMWYSLKNFTWKEDIAAAMAACIVRISMKMYLSQSEAN